MLAWGECPKQLRLAWRPVHSPTQCCCLQAAPTTQANNAEGDSPGARMTVTAFPLPSGLAPLKLGLPQTNKTSTKPWLSVEPVQHGSYTLQRSPSASLHDIKLGTPALQPLQTSAGDATNLLDMELCLLSLQPPVCGALEIS